MPSSLVSQTYVTFQTICLADFASIFPVIRSFSHPNAGKVSSLCCVHSRWLVLFVLRGYVGIRRMSPGAHDGPVSCALLQPAWSDHEFTQLRGFAWIAELFRRVEGIAAVDAESGYRIASLFECDYGWCVMWLWWLEFVMVTQVWLRCWHPGRDRFVWKRVVSEE